MGYRPLADVVEVADVAFAASVVVAEGVGELGAGVQRSEAATVPPFPP